MYIYICTHIICVYDTNCTTYLALAYAFGETNQITAHAKWSSSKYPPKFKPKTLILLNEENKAIGFGKDAKHTYVLYDI